MNVFNVGENISRCMPTARRADAQVDLNTCVRTGVVSPVLPLSTIDGIGTGVAAQYIVAVAARKRIIARAPVEKVTV